MIQTTDVQKRRRNGWPRLLAVLEATGYRKRPSTCGDQPSDVNTKSTAPVTYFAKFPLFSPPLSSRATSTRLSKEKVERLAPALCCLRNYSGPSTCADTTLMRIRFCLPSHLNLLATPTHTYVMHALQPHPRTCFYLI